MGFSLEEQRKAKELTTILSKRKGTFSPVMDFPSSSKILRLDLSGSNSALKDLSLESTKEFDSFILQMLHEKKATLGVGGYMEHRLIYKRSNLFQGADSRFIHLGVDVWGPAFSPVYAPLEGIVHSFKDNAGFGDYGPTIILEHQLENIRFYTLYGHLSKRSLELITLGKKIKKGDQFTELGPFPENGDWPPHLHFQLMLDMEGRFGDFPGVAAPSEVDKFSMLCPDPNLILNLQVLNKATAS